MPATFDMASLIVGCLALLGAAGVFLWGVAMWVDALGDPQGRSGWQFIRGVVLTLLGLAALLVAGDDLIGHVAGAGAVK